MKTPILLLFTIILAFFTFFDSGKTAYAEEDEEIEKEIEETVSGVLDGIDLSEYESFFQELTNEYGIDAGTTIKETVKKIINGEG